MIKADSRHTVSALIGLGVAALLVWWHEDTRQMTYYTDKGRVFGTYYSVQYEAQEDLHDSILAAFTAFDNSLSMFNPHSTLSAINANRDTTTDTFFEAMYAEAQRVHALSDGAFDITVAPLVNFWGFGTKEKKQMLSSETSSAAIDSLLSLVGMDKVQLVSRHLVKADPRIMLDGGAVAKGQACDVIAGLLQKQGCTNYLVDIGGEVVARGVNSKNAPWRIGVTKPNLNNEGAQSELQDILSVSDICMATSGNYRNYYYEGSERRSHTIDPRTGYPVQHGLLSATVVSTSCMRADALATACMVLGEEEGLQMIERAQDAACYFIVAKNDSLAVLTSPNWEEMIKK